MDMNLGLSMRKKITFFEIKYYRKVMGITWMQRKTKEVTK
jgi:hypothetical protein